MFADDLVRSRDDLGGQGAGCGKFLAQWMIHGDAEINMASVDPRRFGGYADPAYTRAKRFDDYHNMFETPLPGREVQAGRPRRVTPLYKVLKAKGAVMTEVHGWERPKYFAPPGFVEKLQFRRSNTHHLVAAEAQAVRKRVALCAGTELPHTALAPGATEEEDP